VRAAALLLLAGGTALAQPAAAPVAARVNGRAITQRAVDAGVPPDAYARRAVAIRRIRLDRLIAQAALRDFLAARRVAVPEADLNRRMAELRRLPPSKGCPCHRFPTLEDFLLNESMTAAEFRDQTRNDLGLERYVAALWAREPRPPLASSERDRIRTEYRRAWQIFFLASQAFGGAAPETMRRKAEAGAQAAWARIRAGEPFERVARAVSQDQASRPKGGFLGPIRDLDYGPEFDGALRKQAEGELQPPFRTAFGYHIARWRGLEAADYAGIRRREFFETRTADLRAKALREARIER
jgi:hypothetical protein